MDKVTKCSGGQTVAEYVYDYNGNRMVKRNFTSGSLANTVTSWTDSYETKVIEGGATENTAYYFANGQLIAKKDKDGNKTYFHNDHLGSTGIITNQSGTLVEETKYDPWGKIKSGGTKSKFLYTGQEHDDETGLDYYNFRYYNSDIRRFAQPDDIIQDMYAPQGLNRYSYVWNNPLRYTDPTGHYAETAVDVAFITMDVQAIVQDPTNVWNYAALAGDAVGFLTPVTGVGLGVKLVEHGGDVKKAMNSYNKTAQQVNKNTSSLTKASVSNASTSPKSFTTKVVQSTQQKLTQTKQIITNGNNLIRIGKSSPSSPTRVSLGPAPKYYQQLSPIQKILSPIHIHIEKKKIGIDLNWLKKAFYKKW